MPLNEKQEAVVSAPFSSNILVTANPGTGKSTVGAERLNRMIDRSRAGGTAFNKTIVAYNHTKYPPDMKDRVKSINGFGHKALIAHFSPSNINSYLQPEKGYWISKDEVEKRNYDPKTERKATKALKKLHDLVRYSCTNVLDTEAVRKLVVHHSLELPFEISDGQEMTLALLMRGWKEANKRIDYVDQVYLPAIHQSIDVEMMDVLIGDELQDTNIMQQKLLVRLGRHITGMMDPGQAIYGFAGADIDSVKSLTGLLNAKVMKLTMNYRCPRVIIELSKRYWPDLEAWEESPEGSIDNVARGDIHKHLRELNPIETVVICRTNQPLIELGHNLTMNKIPWVLQGRGFHVAIEDLVDIVTRNGCKWSAFLGGVSSYKQRRTEALLREEGNEMLVAELEDRVNSVKQFYYAADEEGISTFGAFTKFIEASFIKDDNVTPVDRFLLTTGHGVKGKEFDDVFFLRPDLCPHHMARLDWQKKQEQNLLGIIYTRTKKRLHIVQEPVKSSWNESWDVA